MGSTRLSDGRASAVFPWLSLPFCSRPRALGEPLSWLAEWGAPMAIGIPSSMWVGSVISRAALDSNRKAGDWMDGGRSKQDGPWRWRQCVGRLIRTMEGSGRRCRRQLPSNQASGCGERRRSAQD
jgi:hypothetical protein